ncbi:cation diffusion facilitator family transporter [Calderihabitans maritimus]|uniref:Cation transporter n=1 Tax=Calderihabitans maritimus TaxID=1246530 RepID=A0A1Z5HTP3_9FIRM|nr:cation diffusion facilitator family transporter [Calderihabitans maritimus]GAW92701.1 cation transporter [Calderihabitans maritimus]
MVDKLAAAKLSIVSNSILVLFKLITGLSINSVSIISEAIHSGLDLLASGIAYFSVREASKPADDLHQFGHGKIENLSGTIEAILIVLAAIWIIFEAIKKLLHPTPIADVRLGIIIMLISASVNWIVSQKLFQTARETDSVALEADALHLRTDVYTSAGVLLGFVGIKYTGWPWLDPLLALAVALLIIKEAVRLTREACLPLLDVRLPEEEEKAIVGIIEGHAEHFIEFHKLRTRKAGAERHVDLHLVFPKGRPVAEVHALCSQIEADIKARYPGTQVLIHAEPCDDTCTQCSDCRKLG